MTSFIDVWESDLPRALQVIDHDWCELVGAAPILSCSVATGDMPQTGELRPARWRLFVKATPELLDQLAKKIEESHGKV